ncbi:MAG: uracil-DNA glycosylase [Alphaproteobacteria bacterium]|nr:uracil-DNA glycosylase [Alphaproteobacteria bacterium]MCZ6763335.1 uracil-DNA glycosylase [Alphaproteobacteria bacterium]
MANDDHADLAALTWQVAAGADECMAEAPIDRFAVAPAAATQPQPLPEPIQQRAPLEEARDPARPVAPAHGTPVAESAAQAQALAVAAGTLKELRTTLERFDGCSLKKTATNLVFGDGAPNAPLMLIGEAPGRDEDRQGLPFVGVSGQLLDVMLGHLGLDRGSAYITNILPWRPPGNRQPSPIEIATCLPFIKRHIELVGPKVILFLGGTAAKTLLNRTEGITKLRGRWFDYQPAGGDMDAAIPAMATYHPAYLLRQPASKRLAWQDMLAVQAKLREPAP